MALETVSKRLLGTYEDVPADERTIEFKECLVDVGSTLKENSKTAKIVQPYVSTLDHPAELADSAAVFRAAPGNHVFDTACTKPLTMRLRVIATICVDDFGLAKRSAAYAAKWRDRVDERQQLGNVVAIRATQDGTDGDAIGVDELSTALVKEYGAISIGNVNASALARTRMTKSVLDAGWRLFRTMLQYKSDCAGVWFIEVVEKYSTQICSCCNRRREWACPERGAYHHRDINAAVTILAAGRHRLAEGIPSFPRQAWQPKAEGGEDVNGKRIPRGDEDRDFVSGAV